MDMRSTLIPKMLAISFALLLLVATPAAVLALDGNGGQGDMGNGNDTGHGDNNSQGQQWNDYSGYLNGKGNDDANEKERKNRMLNESVGYMFFGRFDLTDGVADGKFITFALDNSGNVSDFALKNGVGKVTVFDSIQILGFEPTNVSAQGSVLFMLNDTVQVVIHDNPTGMIHVISNRSEVAVSFLLADGINAMAFSTDADGGSDASGDDPSEDGISAITIFGAGMTGVITTEDGNVSINTADSGTYVNVTFSNDHLVFRAHPLFSHHRMSDAAILDAISEGRVAGEISMMVREGLVSFDTMEYANQFHIRLTSAEMNQIHLQVEGQDHAGKVVVLNIDQGTLDASKGELDVKLDGTSVRSTANPLEVLYAEGSDASDAVFCLMQSNGTNQILFYIPSFSVHELTITSLGPLDALLTIAGIAAVLAAIAIVGVAALALSKRR